MSSNPSELYAPAAACKDILSKPKVTSYKDYFPESKKASADSTNVLVNGIYNDVTL